MHYNQDNEMYRLIRSGCDGRRAADIIQLLQQGANPNIQAYGRAPEVGGRGACCRMTA